VPHQEQEEDEPLEQSITQEAMTLSMNNQTVEAIELEVETVEEEKETAQQLKIEDDNIHS